MEYFSTKVSHQDNPGLANYRWGPFTVSCYSCENCEGGAEILDMASMRWIKAQDYPYNLLGMGLRKYADAAYIIGGGPRWKKTPSEYKYDQWRRVGELFHGRMNHRSVTIRTQTLIIS